MMDDNVPVSHLWLVVTRSRAHVRGSVGEDPKLWRAGVNINQHSMSYYYYKVLYAELIIMHLLILLFLTKAA